MESKIEPNYKNIAPLGQCNKCGMALLSTEGNRKVCPNCDTLAEQPSGLVNIIPDPGHEAFVKGNLPKVENDLIVLGNNPILSLPKVTFIEKNDIKGYLQEVSNLIEKIPMPNNMKSIKKLLKIKQLLTELV